MVSHIPAFQQGGTIIQMQKVTIKEDLCKGCGLCAGVCPKQVLALSKDTLNAKGYHPARLIDNEHCISCAMCALICPDVAIRVIKEVKE